MKKKTIVLTGCAGFVGSKVAEILSKDHNIIGIDNLNDYYDVRLKNYRLSKLREFSNFKFFEGDIEDLPTIEKIFSSSTIDSIINLAARAGVRYSIENPHVYESSNCLGNLNLLEIAKKYNVKKFVLASTSSLYAGQDLPYIESMSVSEPISPYAATKKSAEVMAYTYHKLFNIDVSILRYFTVYGPGGRPDMSPFKFLNFIDRGIALPIYGDGTQSRDFTYIDDIARGTIYALKNVGYEIINLGGGKKPHSLNHMINLLEKYISKTAIKDYSDFNKADMKTTWADISKAKKILDWEPKISLEEGLHKMVDDFLKHKDFYKTLTI